ncbi:hypothetical protein JT55_04840 [Rhodovulum sp. NI22]|uniref:Ada DNA repair metal-binding domain-containing protein n=1 Tax=Actibacterium naphthalenivorans TaxID=1614693 RepID=A0A840CFB3_9RHOB|nr:MULTISPECIES: hypothetical protein [Actibacterium]ALG90096.1 hypothetical protein TQ29_07725 [Actibacterium sp. EMB200-NS6]KGB82964.1 hypothetical protein JT55_04840 [Rhodovulum sp. NI22]MBB4021959.1 hypothetical protein [Actibacterium naphthalenivorans]
MPLQNRVQPTGQIIATPARGLFMGNRGILHDEQQRLGAARWRHKAWITCALAFKGRRRGLMTPHSYTELFFLDEAVALAAGHRPCAECRRADFNRFGAAWALAQGRAARAPAMDAALHRARVTRDRRQITHMADIAALPDGAFVALPGGKICLVLGAFLWPYRPEGYASPLPRPAGGNVTVLTPRPAVAVLAAGYRPALHPSAA